MRRYSCLPPCWKSTFSVIITKLSCLDFIHRELLELCSWVSIEQWLIRTNFSTFSSSLLCALLIIALSLVVLKKWLTMILAGEQNSINSVLSIGFPIGCSKPKCVRCKHMLNVLAISHKRKIVFVPTTMTTIIPMQCRAQIVSPKFLGFCKVCVWITTVCLLTTHSQLEFCYVHSNSKLFSR